MKLNEAIDFDPIMLEEDDDTDIITVAAIKAQTGTKERLDRFLNDYGLDNSPPIDELVVIMAVRDEYVMYDRGTQFDEMVYSIDTTNWNLETTEGDFGNTMLVATFQSIELGKLQDNYLVHIGDDYLEAEEGDIEFEFVLCPDVADILSDQDLAEMSLSFPKYIPMVSFQEQIVGHMSSEQFLQLSNGLEIIDDREVD